MPVITRRRTNSIVAHPLHSSRPTSAAGPRPSELSFFNSPSSGNGPKPQQIEPLRLQFIDSGDSLSNNGSMEPNMTNDAANASSPHRSLQPKVATIVESELDSVATPQSNPTSVVSASPIANEDSENDRSRESSRQQVRGSTSVAMREESPQNGLVSFGGYGTPRAEQMMDAAAFSRALAAGIPSGSAGYPKLYSSAPYTSIEDKLLYQYQPIEPTIYLDLSPGCKFSGRQTSGTRQYEVEIEIQHVDLISSQLCGNLTIHKLTNDLPTLTTFFEAEIIGTNSHTFRTLNWKASADVDRQHWSKFKQFSKYSDKFDQPGFKYNLEDEDVVFMRWKERYLLPDYKVTYVQGAVSIQKKKTKHTHACRSLCIPYLCKAGMLT
ncbi:hypothetical protein H4219_002743 [Mycoemilia scoparia]|uniref:Uncharacterized protein n=1 Tax=Mycoemilia scoparia TaxID=417184 RepID=A0A9W8A1R5_9FUNG|nr:hypothetical protein H4219_002743 [Mycoemilia scoparia]